MKKAWCACIECKHNEKNRCQLNEINLSSGFKHTLNEGIIRVWTCRNFEKDELCAKIEDVLKSMR